MAIVTISRPGVKLLKQSCSLLEMKIANQTSAAALVADKKYQADLDSIKQVEIKARIYIEESNLANMTIYYKRINALRVFVSLLKILFLRLEHGRLKG